MADQNLNQIFARFAREGEPEDLAQVFDALAPRLLLVALRMARQQVEAEDLVQETFMRALEGARLYDENRPLLPWLVTILTNEFRERLRRRKLFERRKPEETADPRPPEEIIALSETAEMIEARVDELPESFRAAIRLRLLHGLKGPEIARVLEIPEATVRTRIHRGLEILKKGLPPGLATVLVLLIEGRGLAQVRDEVLGRARKIAPGRSWLMTRPLLSSFSVLGLVAALVLVFGNFLDVARPELESLETAAPDVAASPSRDPGAQELVTPEVEVPAEKKSAPQRGIFGRIVDEQGRGLRGPARMRIMLGPDDLSSQVVETDDDGRYRFDHVFDRHPQIAHQVAVLIEVNSLIPGRRDQSTDLVTITDDDLIRLPDLVLQQGRMVTGRILNDESLPVNGAKVERFENDDTRIDVASTSTDGRFRLDLGAATPTRLSLHHHRHGLAELRLPALALGSEVDLGDIVIWPAAELSGRFVLADGDAVPNLLFSLTPESEGAQAKSVFYRCDAEGHFQVRDLAPGAHVLSVHGDDGHEEDFRVQTGQDLGDLRLSFRQLKVRIRDERHREVVGPVLTLARVAPGDPIAEEPFEFFTHERGLYVAIVKSTGPWRLRATHPLLEMVDQELRFKKDELRKDLTILARRRACTAALEIDLVAHDGGPGEACLEYARPDESYEAVILRVRGRSTIAMPEGGYELAFTSTDSFDLLCFREIELVRDELRRMTLKFERGGKLQIELLGADLSEERRWPRVLIEGRRLGEDNDEDFVRLSYGWPRKTSWNSLPENPPRGVPLEITGPLESGSHHIRVHVGDRLVHDEEVDIAPGVVRHIRVRVD